MLARAQCSQHCRTAGQELVACMKMTLELQLSCAANSTRTTASRLCRCLKDELSTTRSMGSRMPSPYVYKPHQKVTPTRDLPQLRTSVRGFGVLKLGSSDQYPKRQYRIQYEMNNVFSGLVTSYDSPEGTDGLMVSMW